MIAAALTGDPSHPSTFSGKTLKYMFPPSGHAGAAFSRSSRFARFSIRRIRPGKNI
jgi:hypothetical protein